MRNIAVILAGGTASRMGGPLPKQFLACKGRLLIEYAVDAFDKHALVDEVAVVVHPDYMDYMEKVVRRNGWIKVRQLLEGGSDILKAYFANKLTNALSENVVHRINQVAGILMMGCAVVLLVRTLLVFHLITIPGINS